jgi:hypothetical protein
MADIKIDSIQDVKNLLSGDHDSQNKIQIGYNGEVKDSPIRKTGDKWLDSDGNEWEQKNGYAIKLGKEWQQDLREYLHSFPNCQQEICTCTMPKRLDEKMKAIHGMCFDCVVKMEHKIKLEKRWDEYEKEKLLKNGMAWLSEAERDKNLVVEELSRLDFANSFGNAEKWNVGTTKEDIIQKVENEFQEFRKNYIEKLEKDLYGERGEQEENIDNA